MGQKFSWHISYSHQHLWLCSLLGSDCSIVDREGPWCQTVWSSSLVKHFSHSPCCTPLHWAASQLWSSAAAFVPCVAPGGHHCPAQGHGTYPNCGKLRAYLCVCSYPAVGICTSTSQWNTTGQEGGYHAHHLPSGAWPVSSACPNLFMRPLDVPPRQIHTLREWQELQDTQIHWFGANHTNPKRLCLPLVSHCEFLEIVIPGKKTSISKLRGYFLCHIRDLPFFLTLQTTVFKRMTWRLQSKAKKGCDMSVLRLPFLCIQ